MRQVKIVMNVGDEGDLSIEQQKMEARKLLHSCYITKNLHCSMSSYLAARE